jgi:hypothetical protein
VTYEVEYDYCFEDEPGRTRETISLTSVHLGDRNVTAEIDPLTQNRMLNAALALERQPHPRLLQLRQDLQRRRRAPGAPQR